MPQVLEFRLPDLGEGLTEAEIVRWMVQVGDVVEVDQPVVEVETAKAMVEVPCPYGGVVTARYGEEGTELPVGAPLLTVAVGAEEEAAGSPTVGDTGKPGVAAGPGGPAAGEVASSGSGNVLVGYGTGAAPARRRRVRPAPVGPVNGRPAVGGGLRAVAEVRAEPLPKSQPKSLPESVPELGSGAAREAGRAPAPIGSGEGPVPVISPLVRRLARENGLDLRELPGSGPEGLILRSDVENAVRAAELRGIAAGGSAPRADISPGRSVPGSGGANTVAAEPVRATDGPALPGSSHSSRSTGPAGSGQAGAEVRIPLRGLRGAVADKLARSRHEIPDATCWVDADATLLMKARADMNAAGGEKISVLALLARICTAALARFPELNSTVDTDSREIVQLPDVHLGFAAQTPRGLVVPVVRDAGGRDAESLTAEFARLTGLAREGRLTPADLTGGTFTLNNYGVFGVDGSTPIVNHPEAAMLGVGRIIPKPWVHEGELAVRQVVQLSLTFDHRVCDGGTAGGFLRYVADCVEQPAVLLRTL